MSELLRRFYDEIVLTEQSSIEANCKIDDEVKLIMERYSNGSSSDEQLKNMCYEIVVLSEREGFYLGIKHTIKILLEVLSK